MNSVMRRHTREISNSSAQGNTAGDTKWKVELAVLERNPYYTVLSDIIDSIHETKMPTGSSDEHVVSNMSLDFISAVHRNYSFNVSGINNDSVGNLSFGNMMEKQLKAVDYILIVMYTLTTLLAILGNSLAIVIFTRGKRSKTDLRPFLINLAIADLIMAIFCIPFTFTYQLLDTWIFSRPMCPIVMFLQTLSVTGSVSTNMAIGIDRFCAVAFPLNTSRNSRSRYRLIIVIIWIISVAFAGVQLFVGDTESKGQNNQIICKEIWENTDMETMYTILLLILTYVVPVIILTVTYSIVGYLLWKRNLPGNADIQRDQAQLKSKMKIMKMLVTIVVLFALCWLPIHTFFLVLNFGAPVNTQSLYTIYFMCHWIAMSNSFVNPIVYGFLNDSFRIMKMLVTIVVLFALCWLPIHTFFLVLNFGAPVNTQSLYTIYFICHWVAMSNSFVNLIVYGFLNDSFRADLKALIHRTFSCDKSKRTVRHGAVKFKSSRFATYHSSSPGPTEYVHSSYLDVNNSHNPHNSFARTETVTTSFLRL